MARNHDAHHHRWQSIIQNRVSSLSKRLESTKVAAQALKKKSRVPRGVVLLLVALALAWMSYSLTEEAAQVKFEQTRWPTQNIWNATLSHHGLTLYQSMGDFSAHLRNHPNPFNDLSEIWVGNHGCMIYLPRSQYTDSSELWSCYPAKRRLIPKNWIKAGTGIRGLEQALTLIRAHTPEPIAKPHKRRILVDPKEIRY